MESVVSVRIRLFYRLKRFEVQLLYFFAILGPSTVLAEPEIFVVEGEVCDECNMSIAGAQFGAKKNQSPLFFWYADNGETPSKLGRMTQWSGGFDGDDVQQSAKTAPGSSSSFRFDHGLSGAAALGRVDFNGPKLYVWRKKYDDFDLNSEFGLRTRVNNVSGDSPAAGDIVSGGASGATGKVQRVNGPNAEGVSGLWEIYYDNNHGSVADGSGIDFVKGETMSWPGGSGLNTETAGTYRTFNFKTIRIWSEDEFGRQVGPSAIVSAQYRQNDYRWFVEGISGTGQKTTHLAKPRQWVIEEIVFAENTGLGAADGEFSFAVDGKWFINSGIVTRNLQYPHPHRRIYQSQVSNGAQLGSYVYYDSLYIDDSWHRVLLSSSRTWRDVRDSEIQIPTTWDDGRIEVMLRFGSLDPEMPMYLYVVDGEGNANEEGFRLECPKCGVAPDPLIAE